VTTAEVVRLILVAVLSAVLGYALGVFRDQQAERYKRRVEEAAVELRERTMQVERRFPHITSWVRYSAHELPRNRELEGLIPEFRPLEELDKQLRIAQDNLRDFLEEITETYRYFHAKKPWLSSNLQKDFEALTGGILDRATNLNSIVNAQLSFEAESQKVAWHRERLLKAADEHNDWTMGDEPEDLPALRDAFEAQVERATGTHPSRWRRWWRRWGRKLLFWSQEAL